MILHLKAKEVALDRVFTLKWLLSFMSVLFHLLQLSTVSQQSSLIAIHTEIIHYLLYTSRLIWLNEQTTHAEIKRKKNASRNIHSKCCTSATKQELRKTIFWFFPNSCQMLCRSQVLVYQVPHWAAFLLLLLFHLCHCSFNALLKSH